MMSAMELRKYAMDKAVEIFEAASLPIQGTPQEFMDYKIAKITDMAIRIEETMGRGLTLPAVSIDIEPKVGQIVINRVQKQEQEEEAWQEDEIDAEVLTGYMAVYEDSNGRRWGDEIYDTDEEAREHAARYAGFKGVTRISITL